MLINDVTVGSNFLAKPFEEWKLNGRLVDVYRLFKVDDEANYYRGQLVVPARSTRRTVIERALAKIETDY